MVALVAIASASADPSPIHSAVRSVAQEPLVQEPNAQESEGTLVLPFTDVSPDHWAYAALLNLAGSYDCISGYSDSTFRGETAITRYEFAVGTESCLSVISSLAQAQQAGQEQTVQALIDAIAQSLQELRQLETELPETP